MWKRALFLLVVIGVIVAVVVTQRKVPEIQKEPSEETPKETPEETPEVPKSGSEEEEEVDSDALHGQTKHFLVEMKPDVHEFEVDLSGVDLPSNWELKYDLDKDKFSSPHGHRNNRYFRMQQIHPVPKNAEAHVTYHWDGTKPRSQAFIYIRASNKNKVSALSSPPANWSGVVVGVVLGVLAIAGFVAWRRSRGGRIKTSVMLKEESHSIGAIAKQFNREFRSLRKKETAEGRRLIGEIKKGKREYQKAGAERKAEIQRSFEENIGKLKAEVGRLEK